MIISVDTTIRDEFGISTDAYMLLDCIWKGRNHEKDYLALALSWSRQKIGILISEVEAAGLFTEATGEFSDQWTSLYDPRINIDLSGLKSLTGAIIDHLVLRTGRSFRDGKTFQKAIQRLVKAAPDHTSEKQFKALIDWMVSTWEAPYKDYIQPSWFECSPEKYVKFCEKANEYWRTKNNQSQV